METIGEYTSYVNEAGAGHEPEFVCQVKTYRDGSHRVKVSRCNPRIEENRELLCCGLPGARKSEGLSEDDKRRSLSRTKTTLYDSIRQIQADRLLTLTVRENIQDLPTFQSLVKRFLRATRRLPLRFEYVLVFEQQKRGAWHVHMAIKGFKDVRVLRRLWWSIVGKGMGNIDISYKPQKPHNLCRYLSKYVAKNCDEVGYNKKRYWRSDDIGGPAKVRFYFRAQTVSEAIGEVQIVCMALGIKTPEKSLWVSPDASVMVVDG
jgi:hypothetical protein